MFHKQYHAGLDEVIHVLSHCTPYIVDTDKLAISWLAVHITKYILVADFLFIHYETNETYFK